MVQKYKEGGTDIYDKKGFVLTLATFYKDITRKDRTKVIVVHLKEIVVGQEAMM